MIKTKPRYRVKFSIITAVAVSAAFFALAVYDIHLTRSGRPLPPWVYPLIGVGMVATIVWSYSMHRKAITGKRLAWLQSVGMTVEQREKYWGLKGIYKGYFMRLFINPESRFSYRQGPDLCVMVYFTPMRRSDGKRDIALLRKMEEDLTASIFDFRLIEWHCGAIHIARYAPYRWFSGQRMVQRNIDKVIDKVKEHGLRPWPEDEVEAWISRSPDLHGPDIDTFQAAYPAPTEER